ASGRSLCLDAITILLNEACSVQHPYLSTKNLELASLQFCLACRSVSTLHVNVGRNTPKRLWATSVEEASTAVSRVPLLRARGVTCMECAPAHFMCSENDILSRVEHVEFSPDFNRSLENVVWPRGVENITFPSVGEELPKFNQPIDRVVWPASLRELVIQGDFDQPIEQVVWPSSLQYMNLDSDFNHPIDGVVWPPSLQRL
ncbi:unnamed protein product, partial [Sphacelaria rigidula]